MIGLGIVFGLSAILLICFTVFRIWEIRRGLTFLPGPRRHADTVVENYYEYGKKSAASGFSFIHNRVLLPSVHVVVEYLLRAVRWLERKLSVFTHMIRGDKVERGDHEASSFLKSVEEHKRSLIKKRRFHN